MNPADTNTLFVTTPLSGLAYGGGVYVGVGGLYPIASRDPYSWTTFTFTNEPPQRVPISAVAYGAGEFVGVGGNGLVATSADGSKWLQRSLPSNANLHALAYGNGTWVMLGEPDMIVSTNLAKVGASVYVASLTSFRG